MPPLVPDQPGAAGTVRNLVADANTDVRAAQAAEWEQALAAVRGGPYDRPRTWPDEHFAISAFLLTHAIADSGF